jgi:hypothetical protein
MLERDPEVERLLAPERTEPPAVSDAFRDRLWGRIRQSVERPPARSGISPAWFLVVLALGVALGVWFRPAESPAPSVMVPATQPTAPPSVSPVAEDAGVVRPSEPASPAFDVAGSRREIRKALEADSLLRATSLLDEHQRGAPGDDVSEERDALLVRSAALSKSSDLAARVASFRARYPDSSLLVGLEVVQWPAPPAQEPARDGGACVISGQITLQTTDPTVSLEDLVVAVVVPKGSAGPTAREPQVLPVGPNGFPTSEIIEVLSPARLPATRGLHAFAINGGPSVDGPSVNALVSGVFVLRCLNHPSERAVLTAVPQRSMAVRVSADGSFTLRVDQPKRTRLTILEPNGAEMTLRPIDPCDGVPVKATIRGRARSADRRFE